MGSTALCRSMVLQSHVLRLSSIFDQHCLMVSVNAQGASKENHGIREASLALLARSIEMRNVIYIGATLSVFPSNGICQDEILSYIAST